MEQKGELINSRMLIAKFNYFLLMKRHWVSQRLKGPLGTEGAFEIVQAVCDTKAIFRG